MKKLFFVFILVVSFSSCNTDEKKKNSETLTMREQSEMSVLMNKMYDENEKVKQQILNGEVPKGFPEDYSRIHTATLTDPSDRTQEFKAFSELYINTLKDVFETNERSLKNKFNATINSCIACHKTTCLGPIPKIKKLLIR
ncbi:MAG: hypothetical protein JXR05_09390 [Flavobacteriaceae bacterium]